MALDLILVLVNHLRCHSSYQLMDNLAIQTVAGLVVVEVLVRYLAHLYSIQEVHLLVDIPFFHLYQYQQVYMQLALEEMAWVQVVDQQWMEVLIGLRLDLDTLQDI